MKLLPNQVPDEPGTYKTALELRVTATGGEAFIIVGGFLARVDKSLVEALHAAALRVLNDEVRDVGELSALLSFFADDRELCMMQIEYGVFKPADESPLRWQERFSVAGKLDEQVGGKLQSAAMWIIADTAQMVSDAAQHLTETLVREGRIP